MRAYVVQQGEDLASLGARLGFDPAAVWGHEKNRELRELRRDPGVLARGDILFVPDEPPRPEELVLHDVNRFRAGLPKIRLRLVLSAGGPEPLRDEPFRIEGLSTPIEGTSDGDGVLDVQVPAHVREVRLVLPRLATSTTLTIAHLDPVERGSGVRQRLIQLGYLVPVELFHLPRRRSGSRDADLAAALRAFQRDRGLELTGTADEPTRRALREAHGT